LIQCLDYVFRSLFVVVVVKQAVKDWLEECRKKSESLPENPCKISCDIHINTQR